MQFLHSGAFLSVGTVVQIHSQLPFLDMSFNFFLPVMNQRSRTDDQSAFRRNNAGVWKGKQMKKR